MAYEEMVSWATDAANWSIIENELTSKGVKVHILVKYNIFEKELYDRIEFFFDGRLISFICSILTLFICSRTLTESDRSSTTTLPILPPNRSVKALLYFGRALIPA